jgi:MFS family permease
MTPHILQFLSFRLFVTIAMQMKMTILGYFLYQITGEPLSLGLLGLYEALPRVLMALPAGYFIERIDKKKAVMYVTFGYLMLCFGLFLTIHYVKDVQSIKYSIFGLVFVMGILGSMGGTASTTLFSLLIPAENKARYSAINSNSWQLGAVIGPILGGFLLAKVGAENAILVLIGFMLLGFISLWNLPRKPSSNLKPFSINDSIGQIREGIDFVIHNKAMIWAISLDLFAVLFGGCVALLPIFSKDILQVDSTAYGWLRSAMSIGAVSSMVILARFPLQKNTGRWLLFAVAMFGVCTIGFALSKWFLLSLFLLILMGAFDAISVVIRGTILLLETPESMRARVTSVNSMFISSSNEIGAFESGFAAQYMGTIRSVVFGGCMTLLFAAYAYRKGKVLRNYEFETAEKALI